MAMTALAAARLPRSNRTAAGSVAALAARLAVWVLVARAAVPAAAQPQTLPGNTWGTVHRNQGAGLRIDVDTRWVPGPGYRPVQVTVTPAAPPIADRSLVFEFMGGSRWRHQSGYELLVAERIEIPAGSGPVQKTVSVPGACLGTDYRFRVVEDGNVVKSLSSDWIGTPGAGPRGEEQLPRVLIVVGAGTTSVDTSQIAAILPTSRSYGGQIIDPQAPGAAPPGAMPPAPPPLFTAAVKNPAELSSRWIDHSGFDLIAIPLEELAALSRREPEKFRAILAWTAAGGSLLVWGVGDRGERLAELESLVGIVLRSGKGDTPAARGWSEPSKDLYGRPIPGISEEEVWESGRRYNPPAVRFPAAPAPQPAPKARPLPPLRADFFLHEYELGRIVALGPANPFPGTPEKWSWILAHLGDRLLWVDRHGMSATSYNPQFWNFLIPGVGLAPVFSFEVLITLFVLGIGPANYLLLRRWKRLHFLIVTVPLSAAAITLALFGYALVSDGLGTRLRVRSFTRLDQARGRAACWARLSYYCGLAPSGGLGFPDDVAVNLLEALPGEYFTIGREVLWTDQQWFSRGWLASRTPVQLLTVRSRPTRARLIVTEGTAGGVSVENRLGTRIAELLVCTEGGRFFAASDLDRDATAELAPVEVGPAFARLAAIGQENEPAFPRDLDPTAIRYLYGSRYSYRRAMLGIYSPGGRPNELPPGLLEDSIRALVRPGAGSLTPRSYVAIVERSPEVVSGTPSAREEAGFHVIHGTW